MKILGIDPGIGRVGWGLVETAPGGMILYKGCGRITTPTGTSTPERIAAVSRELRALIKKTKPERAVVEKLFFAKNRKTAMMVAESRGAILLALHQARVSIYECTPTEVKRDITGNGAASKKQVGWMVKNILKIKEKIASDDALDALALCLMFTN